MVYKPKNKYSWGDGWHPKMDANVVGGVVEKIESEHGAVTKELLLEESRPEDSATHSMFEWDNDKAAEKWRLEQAKQTINALRVVYVKPDKEKVTVKAFVNVSDFSNKAVFRNVDIALRDEDMREIYLKRIRSELEAYIKRNQDFEELADLLIEYGNKLKLKKGA